MKLLLIDVIRRSRGKVGKKRGLLGTKDEGNGRSELKYLSFRSWNGK